jgi:tetratricopeptide (TPR) repeat protein
LEQALTLARTAHLRSVEAGSLWSLGSTSGALGYYGEATVYFEQAWRVFHEIGARRRELHLRLRLGIAAAAQGDYAEAMVHCEEAVAGLREIGDRWEGGYANLPVGRVYHSLGKHDTARAHYEQYLANCREVGDRRGEAMALSQLALLFHDGGDDKAAWEHLERALQMAVAQGHRDEQGRVLTRLGHALTGLLRLDEAGDAYRRALVLRRESAQSHLAMEALAGLARVLLAQGDLGQALAYVEEILGHLQTATLNGTDEPSRVYLTCYRALRANGDGRADDILEEAHRLLQERAARISDEHKRRSYLENVAANREIASEYALVRGV